MWLLEHDYGTAGLSFDRLKNADGAVGGALARAARQAGHSLHAAILHIEEHGIAVDTGDYIDWDKPESSWEMEEVFHSELWLDGWVAPDDTKRDYGRVPLLPGELVPAGALEYAEPDDEQVNVTGNEGVELSHSYRRAALVLWPERDTVRTLAHGGIGGAVAYVADELAHPGTRRTRQDLHAPSSLSSSTPGRRRGARIPTVAMAVTVRRAARTRCGCCTELRRHVHGIIDGNGLDMTHETERSGRPYTLVCTKTRGAYERRRARYAVDIAHMRLLVAAAQQKGAPEAALLGELTQLRTAIEASSVRVPQR